jgi:hypothetical protein
MFGIILKKKEKPCSECPKIAEARKIKTMTETFTANESINSGFSRNNNFGGVAY